jgi:subtilisin family serine protease
MKLLFALFILFSLNLYGQTTNRQVIIKFNYAYLDFNIVDDKDYFTFPVKQILKSSAKEYLLRMENEFPGFSDWELRKIFSLTTKDTVSISRLGEKVTIPPFWAAFVLTLPNNIDPNRIIPILDKFSPFIDYAHPNFKVIPTSPPDDQFYSMQESLHAGPGIPYAGINIEEAWEIETGKPFIKVGVHDTGIDSTHEDLDVIFGGAYYGSQNNVPDWGTDQEGHGSAVAGIIGAKRNNGLGVAGIAGGDSLDKPGVSLIDFKYPFLESASVNYILAGIVDGARRVGTYWDYPDNYYDSYSGYTDSQGNSTDNFTYFQGTPGFGIQVANHSYVIRTDLPQVVEPPQGSSKAPGDENDGMISLVSCELCREAYLFSLKNGVINVVARGNSGTVAPSTDPTYIDNLYPQSFPDNWIILVGASGYDGTTVQDGLNQSPTEAWQNYYSLYGNGMDIIAPGSDSIVYTTLTTSNIPSTFPYRKFSGTSSAAPHATGVVALLLSHYNKSCYNKRNLSIEDVEYILETSATNLNPPSYDYAELTGWGRLNAGEALKKIENSTKQIIHPDNLISSSEASRDTIVIGYRDALVADGWGPISRPFPLVRNKNYKVERVKIENSYSYSQYMTSATQIIDIWPRWSSSNALNYLSDTSLLYMPITPLGWIDTTLLFDIFDITPHDTIESVDYLNKVVKTSGYYYHFIAEYAVVLPSFAPDALNEDHLIDEWYPINPFVDTAKIPFSMYIIDTTLTAIYDFPCDSINLLYDQNLSVSNLNKDIFEISVFPNPTQSFINIKVNGPLYFENVSLIDMQGKKLIIMDISSDKMTLDISSVKSGVYFLNFRGVGGCRTYKIIKS